MAASRSSNRPPPSARRGAPLLGRLADRLVALANHAVSLDERRIAYVGTTVHEATLVLARPLTALIDEALIVFGLADSVVQLAGLDELHALTQHQIRRGRERIWRPGARHDDIVEACDAANHQLRRGLRVVLAAVGNDDAVARLWRWDVDSAIRVRGLYAHFRSSLVHLDADAPEGVVRHVLALAFDSLNEVITHDVFREVRGADRRALVSLRARLLGWSMADGALEGRHLLSDIHVTARLLLAINLREELREHDLAALARLQQLARLDESAADEIAHHLALLRGRDDAIDALRTRLAIHGADLHTRSDLAVLTSRLTEDLVGPCGASA